MGISSIDLINWVVEEEIEKGKSANGKIEVLINNAELIDTAAEEFGCDGIGVSVINDTCDVAIDFSFYYFEVSDKQEAQIFFKLVQISDKFSFIKTEEDKMVVRFIFNDMFLCS